MSASADKVQFILEKALQESIPLVKRGIFSQVELKQMMHCREKHENAMLKREYRMTDYLAAIEYEYELERERRARMDQLAKLEDGHINPAYKKESSADFAIVKRILRLWDKTMHKYKFKLHLWKQYIQFCITIGSKKHFYKALTNALRFLPFQVDLWRIGMTYEQEVGHNLWKGRKILIKGLKMIPSGLKNVELGEDMLRFQVEFLKTILQRRQILLKGSEGMKLIGEEQQIQVQSDKQEKVAFDNINLGEYNQVLWIIVEEIISKNRNESIPSLTFATLKTRLLNLIKELVNQQTINEIVQILKKVKASLSKSEQIKTEENNVLIEEQDEIANVVQQKGVKLELGFDKSGNDWDKLTQWKERIYSNEQNQINWKQAEQAIKTFCLKPHFLSEVYSFLLDINHSQTIAYLLKNKASTKLPVQIINRLIAIYLSQERQGLSEGVVASLKLYLKGQIDRRVLTTDYKDNRDLLKAVIRFNAYESRYESTTRLMRSLSILYKNEPEFLQLCNRLSNIQ